MPNLAVTSIKSILLVKITVVVSYTLPGQKWTGPIFFLFNRPLDLGFCSYILFGAVGIFGKRRARVGYGPVPGPTKKKALCHTCSLGGASNKYRSYILFSHRSGQVCPGLADSRSRCAFTGILVPPEGASPRLYPSLEGLGLSPGVWGPPLMGNADGFRGIFGAAGRVWATVLRWTHLKKALCHTHLFGGARDK